VAFIGLAVIGVMVHRRTVIRKNNDRQGKRWGGTLKESLAGDRGITWSGGSDRGRVIEDVDCAAVIAPSRMVTRSSSNIKKALVSLTRTASRTTSKVDATTNKIDVEGLTLLTPREQTAPNCGHPCMTLI
jgi:hypothetical protein